MTKSCTPATSQQDDAIVVLLVLLRDIRLQLEFFDDDLHDLGVIVLQHREDVPVIDDVVAGHVRVADVEELKLHTVILLVVRVKIVHEAHRLALVERHVVVYVFAQLPALHRLANKGNVGVFAQYLHEHLQHARGHVIVDSLQTHLSYVVHAIALQWLEQHDEI